MIGLNTPLRADGKYIYDADGLLIATCGTARTAQQIVIYVNTTAQLP